VVTQPSPATGVGNLTRARSARPGGGDGKGGDGKAGENEACTDPCAARAPAPPPRRPSGAPVLESRAAQDAETAKLRGALGGAILTEKPNVQARGRPRSRPHARHSCTRP